MMGGLGLPRRFLNMIVYGSGAGGVETLRCIDLLSRRHKLFNTPAPPPPEAAANMNGEPQQTATPWVDDNRFGTIRLPSPVISFQGPDDRFSLYVKCSPVAGAGGRKVLCVDQSGRTLLFDTVTRQVSMDWPSYPHSKRLAIPIFVPGGGGGSLAEGGDHGSIYVMATHPHREHSVHQLSHQYEAFVYRSSRPTDATETGTGWQRQLLPPPPFVCDGKVAKPFLTSYAVLHGAAAGGAPAICISADGGAGTYCLDTATHTWTKLGNWTLPFTGKVEYVPELKLWFGMVRRGRDDRYCQLGAADLSTMNTMAMESRQPQLVGTWNELADEPLPQSQGWTNSGQLTRPEFVSLGSGRFCIARFLYCSYIHLMDLLCINSHELIQQDYFTVLTGVDVVPRALTNNVDRGAASATYSNDDGNGSDGLKVQLQMISHNSRRHVSDGQEVTLVF